MKHPVLLERPNANFSSRDEAGAKSFWKHIKTCTGYAKLCSFLHPWPNANPTLASRSTNTINSFLCTTVSSLIFKFTTLSWELPLSIH